MGYIENFTPLSEEIHADNVAAGWWTDLATGERKQRNMGEMLMLVVSELSEADEGDDGALMDDKLPHRRMFEVELADAKIRLLDIAGSRRLDLTVTATALLSDGYNPRSWGPVSSQLMGVVNCVSEAMEGDRKGNADVFEAGLAKALLRIHGTAECNGVDVDAAMAEKRAFNATRADHKIENRLKAGGKVY